MSTSSDLDILEQRVRIYLPSVFSDAVRGGAIIAIQILMCSYSLYIYFRTPKPQQRGRLPYLIISIILFILDTVYRICYMTSNFAILTQPADVLEVAELEAELYDITYMKVGRWFGDIALLLGDGLLVYRCFVVWTGVWIICLLPAAIYLAFVALTLWSEITSGVVATQGLEIAFVLLTAAVNCSVTILIAFKLLQMRRRQIKILQNSGVNFDSKVYLGVIGIVAESALPFALAGILYAISYRQYHVDEGSWKPWKIAGNVALALFDTLSILSPQLIIWRVAMGRSFAHSDNKSSESAISTLAFHRSAAEKDFGASGAHETSTTTSCKKAESGIILVDVEAAAIH